MKYSIKGRKFYQIFLSKNKNKQKLRIKNIHVNNNNSIIKLYEYRFIYYKLSTFLCVFDINFWCVWSNSVDIFTYTIIPYIYMYMYKIKR